MPTLRVVCTEYDLGPAGWELLRKLARKRNRDLRDQAQHLIYFALDRASAGEDVELSQERLDALLPDNQLVA